MVRNNSLLSIIQQKMATDTDTSSPNSSNETDSHNTSETVPPTETVQPTETVPHDDQRSGESSSLKASFEQANSVPQSPDSVKEPAHDSTTLAVEQVVVLPLFILKKHNQDLHLLVADRHQMIRKCSSQRLCIFRLSLR